MDGALLTHNFAKKRVLFVKVTKLYSNRRVFLCNAILVTEIPCYRYSTINNSARK